MRYLVLVLAFLFTTVGAMAQGTGAAASAGNDEIDALIRIIENDDTRSTLIERLRQSGAGEGLEAPPADLSFARQLAEYTRSVAEGTSATLRTLGSVFVDLQQGVTGTANADFNAFADVVVGVFLVALGIFGSFLILRFAMLWAQRRIAADAVGRKFVPRLLAALGAALVDLAVVLGAWAAGNAVAVLTGYVGVMGINQSLLLNAFLLIELCKLVVRAVLAPRFASLRLIPINDDNAAYWSFWISRIISLLGYTFLLVTPILSTNLSVGVATAAQVLVMATAVTIGIVIVLQNKDDVRHWLERIAKKRGNDGYGQLLVLLGQHWHTLAIVYLLALLVVWLVNPAEALPFMLGATVQSLIAILAGAVIVGFITRGVSAGLQLSDDIKTRLPLLEARLHAFVPRVIQVVRWIVIAAVVIAIAQAWALFDFVGWIGTEAGQHAAGSLISATLIIVVCIVAHVVVASWVEYQLNTDIGKTPTPREKTLLGLFKNAFTSALVLFGVMLALAQIGVNIAPLLAGAGVIGLAIGFGAQKLVQDVITGIFIQFENVMNEGDVVALGDKTGTVEKLTIRSVTIRDLTGTVHLIPFSSVDQVSNMVRGFSFHVAEIRASYDSDIGQIKLAMQEAFDRLLQTEFAADIIDVLDMHGVTGFTESAVTVRARIKTKPGKHWAAGRAYSELIKQVFDERGLKVPYPQINYVAGGRGKSGEMLPPPMMGEMGT